MTKKNITKILLFAGMAALFMTACHKDSATLRLRIAQFNSDGKVYINNSYTPVWEVGDEVVINETVVTIPSVTGSTATCQVPGASYYKAVYPASFVNNGAIPADGNITLTIPQYQEYLTGSNGQVVKAPMGANAPANASGNATLQFHNLGALLAIQVTNDIQTSRPNLVVDNIQVTASGASLWGSASLVFDSETPAFTITSTGEANRTVTLRGVNASSMNVSINSPRTFYVYIPAIPSSSNNRFTITVTAHNDAGVGTYTRSQTNSYGNIERGKYAPVSFKLSESTEGWTPNEYPEGSVFGGKFTIGYTGSGTSRVYKQVYFAQGNLQYQCSTHVWRFAPNQYDYIGSDNSNISNTYDGYIDLFGWGTGNNPTKFGTTSTAATFGNGNTPLSGVYDWGSNMSTSSTTWRTLTYNEWAYLLSDERPIQGSARYNTGTFTITVAGVTSSVSGMLIYSDDFTGTPFGNGFSKDISLLPQGCVFLPKAGYRDNTTIHSDFLYYWTATQRGTDKAMLVDNLNGQYRSFGCAVRLASDVPASSSSK